MALPQNVIDYIDKYADFAFEVEESTGVPALVMLAQSAWETGWGKSYPGYNFFGIKADAGWKGEKRVSVTQEFVNGKYVTITDYFRAYSNAKASFSDYALFLQENSRYSTALKYKTDPYRFIEEVARAGYATAPTYSTSVQGTMRNIESYVNEKKKGGR